MHLTIFRNELDFEQKENINLLKEWVAIRNNYPDARLYKNQVTIDNDVTPKTKQQVVDLQNVQGNYFIVCHAGDPITAIVVGLVVGLAFTLLMPKPKIPTISNVTGGSNNSLSERKNQNRAYNRVPDIYGTVKSIPDLIAPTYRYYKDNVLTEECLMCVGRGYFDITDIKEAESPIETITGASVSIYPPNVDLVNGTPQIEIGSNFNVTPLVAKQISAIDGKQMLLPPNDLNRMYRLFSFSDNKIINHFDYPILSDLFRDGELITIKNANYPVFDDLELSDNVTVSSTGVITIFADAKSTQYEKLQITTLTVTDTENGELDLSGAYDIDSIGTNFIKLKNLSGTNFALVTDDVTGDLIAALKDNTEILSLDGEYTIATVSEHDITLVNPSSVNPDWDRLVDLSQSQIDAMLATDVTLQGSAFNYIGWYYAGSDVTTGIILNFIAPNGIYKGDERREVEIEVQVEQIVNGVPSGTTYTYTQTMIGKGANRDKIGISFKYALLFTGQYRFRARSKTNNGNEADLSSDVYFESAYSYYKTTRITYPDVTVLRLQRLAVGSGTNDSELNLIATRRLHSYVGGYKDVLLSATNRFSDIVINMATDDLIGRMTESELDIAQLNAVYDEVQSYFGTDISFNYTYDDKNASYQEMITDVAQAVFCTARRENGKHFLTFERETANSLMLFNHRNTQPNSLKVTEAFGIENGYDGIELTWRDANDNYTEAVIKLPDGLKNNYKKIELPTVTNLEQAMLHAWRNWNKLRFAKKSIEFTAYGEADLVTLLDRVAVVDTTIPLLASGEIIAQNGLTLTIDNAVVLSDDAYIFLQLKSGIVDAILIDSVNGNVVLLSRPPLMSVDGVVYEIAQSIKADYSAYLITEKRPSGTFESEISATKYDARFYSHDKDYWSL